MNKKFSPIFLSLALALAVMAVPSWGENTRTGVRAFPTNPRTTSVDTLEWSDQGSYNEIDTLTSTIKDTTTSLIDITGCSRVSLWVILGSLTTGYKHITLTPQVSPDKSTWISFATTFTAVKATTASDSLVAILYDQDYAIDTLAARDVTLNMKLPVGRDFRLLKAARYLRVLSVPSGPDSATVKAILRREWP